ncbi:hypothetical protein BDV18DRAFT_157989 [Aspergillus unguis]
MDETADERLNRLQEADLGTARREYISTVDHGFRETRVQVIEATRRSNMQGTEEQRIAAANKSRLDGWANMHKTIGDTGDLEDLDDLLHGQTHRLSLTQMLQGGGAQEQGYPGRNGGNSRPPPPDRSSFHGGPAGSASAASNGSRPNQSSQHPGRFPQLGPKAPRKASRLDPALNCNNIGQDTKITGRHASSAQKAPNPIITRSRRPLPTSTVPICSPEEFLAEARRNNTSKPSNEKPSTEKLKPRSPAKAKSPAIVTTASKTARAQASGVLQSLVQNPTTRQLPPSTPKNSAKSQLSADLVEKTSPEEAARAFLNNTIGNQEELDAKAQDIVVKPKAKDPIPHFRPQKNVGMLVDLDFTTDTEAEANKSPAFEDLQGLDFKQSSMLQNFDQPSLATAHSDIDSDERLPEEQQTISASVNATITTDALDDEETTEYKREIDIVCQLLECTTLSETFFSSLTDLKQELESRLQRRQASTAEKRPAAVASIQEEPEVFVSDPKETEAEAVALDATKVAPKHGHSRTESSMSRGSTPSSSSRLNAAAPQFTPKSFTEYRSLSDATSTDTSTVLQPTPSKVVPQPQSDSASSDATIVTAREETPSLEPLVEPIWPEFTPSIQRAPSGGHIFGDHILPGGRASKPVNIKKPDGTHLFGDHLLPGRHGTLPSNQVAPASNGSALTHAAVPGPSSTTFCIPPKSRPLPIVNPNTLVPSKPKSDENTALTPSAPAYQKESKNVLSPKPTNVASSAAVAKGTVKPTSSMMESMYAPKPQGASTATTGAKKSSNQGLMASRYSNPQWL